MIYLKQHKNKRNSEGGHVSEYKAVMGTQLALSGPGRRDSVGGLRVSSLSGPLLSLSGIADNYQERPGCGDLHENLKFVTGS